MTLTNTIVANNTGGNCTATMTITGSNNLQFPGTTCAGAITTADPMLGPLTNGVYPLLAGSQAIDMGTNIGCPSTDQLGTARPQGAACDIGAYEAVNDLTISKSHTGNFTQGQTGAQYTITVSNAGSAPSSGTVTVVDTLPAGLTATALSGAGWNCDLATLTCTRSDALTAGNSYPTIILTVNVASNAPSSVTNSASVSGGGDQNSSNNTATDPTTINPVSPAPICNGQAATIYVNNSGIIVGGPNNGQPYAGNLNGTAGADVIVGTSGRDEVSARGGSDVVCGGGDNDKLEGGGGRDQLFGQGGNDILRGGEGNDELDGGGGRDQLFGQGGNDVLAGEDGNDTLTGGLGADRFRGGGGTDTATDFTPAQGDTKTGVENF
jgi:uncharacterized repeat protein (TIGR01451 family)